MQGGKQYQWQGEDEWLSTRHRYIGATDVAPILGLSPYKTAYDVWAEKTGRNKGETTVTEPMRWGTLLEAIIADEWARSEHKSVQKAKPMVLGNIRVSPDYTVLGEDVYLEVKTSSAWSAWDKVPTHYRCQVEAQMCLSDTSYAYVGCLFGGNDLQSFKVIANPDIQSRLVGKLEGWWERHVVADTPPELQKEDDLAKVFQADSSLQKEATEDINERINELKNLKRHKKHSDGMRKDLETEVKKYMGEATELIYQERTIATWRETKRKPKFDWESYATHLENELRRLEGTAYQERAKDAFLRDQDPYRTLRTK